MAFVDGRATGIVNAVPLAQMFNSTGSSISSVKLVMASVASTNGAVTFYPTTDGTATGTPLLSQVLHADATAWSNTATATQVPLIAGKAIAADLKSVTFNVLTGASVVLGGATLAAAPNGTMVSCVMWGTP